MIRFLFKDIFNRIVIILFFSFVFANISFSQEDVLILPDENSAVQEEGTADIYLPVEEEPEKPVSVGFQVFYDAWNSFVESSRRGDDVSANAALVQLLELKNKNSILALPEFAEAAVQSGNRELERKNPKEAMKYYNAAIALNPSQADAHYGQARSHFAQGIGQYQSGLAAAIRGFLAPRNSFGGKIYLYSKLLFVILATFIAISAVFAIILLLKYNRLLRHDAEERLSKKLSGPAANLLVWILIVLPVLLLLGPLWLIPFWLALFAPYGRTHERVLALICLALFIFVYPVYSAVSKYVGGTSDTLVVSYMNAISAGPNPKIVSDFEKYVNQNPADRDARIMLAYLYKNNEMYEEASVVLQRMILDAPDDSRAPNNLAVICFAQGETEYAVRLTQKASQLSPRNAIYKYNLSKMFRSKFNFEQAKKYLDEAKAADPLMFRRGEPSAQNVLLDAIPSAVYVRNRLQNQLGDPRQLFKSPFSAIPAALFLIALILCWRIREESHAHRCIKCGQAFCKKCQTSDRSYGFCIQCLHIFVKKDGVSPVSRKEKMAQIDTYSSKQRWLRFASAIVVPGSCDMYEGRIVWGVITMLLWFLSLAVALFMVMVAPLSTFESGVNAGPIILICLAVMAVLYITTLIRQFRRLNAEE
jgi:tetratricopeptide (TPR) repeat protein